MNSLRQLHQEFLRGARAERILTGKTNGLGSFDTSPFCVFARDARKLLKDKFGTRSSRLKGFRGAGGRVAKTSGLSICRSLRATKVRILARPPGSRCGVAENRRAIASSDVRKRSNSGRRPICGRNGKNDAAQEKCVAKD